MCGIAGVLSKNRPIIRPAVQRMLRAMLHRGPDDEGYEEVPLADRSGFAGQPTPQAGLGFRRLSIMDLTPAGHQPMVDPQSGNWLIFNGEIYNFRSLKSRLPEAARGNSTGDTVVLLHALTAWGEKALHELDGMFAFAFYHSASRRILLARDHLGIKPLYVGTSPEAFVFASEVRAVLASGLIPDDFDPAGVAGFLAYGAPQDPLTLHRHVKSLPPGSYQWIGGEAVGGPSLLPAVRYWRFPAVGSFGDSEAAAKETRSLLAEAVAQQCVADAPLGAFLSGGIDSASVVALAQLARPPIDTLSVGFECAGGGDESLAAAETAHALGTRHRQTIIDQDWVLLQWAQWIKAADRPTVDGLNTYIISGAVKDLNISVALSGVGADELFCGYSTFSNAPRLSRALSRIEWIPSGIRRQAALLACLAMPASKRTKAATLAGSPADAASLTLKLRRLASDAELLSLGFRHDELGLTPDFVTDGAFDGMHADGDPIAAVSRAELAFYMGNTLLRDADVYSMAHSLEIRVPFLSRPLVEAACALPGVVRSPPGTKAKHVLRGAMHGIVPDAVFHRPKSGFTLPVGEWLAGTLRPDAEESIDALATSTLVPEPALRRMWETYIDPRGNLHWSRAMSLVSLGAYLRQHRDRSAQLRKDSSHGDERLGEGARNASSRQHVS